MSSEDKRRPVVGVDDLPAPLDLPGLVRSAWGLYRRRFRLWVVTTGIGYLILHALQTLGIEIFLRGRLSDTGEQLVEFILVMVLVAIAGSVVTVLLVPAMAATVFEAPITFREAARVAGGRGRHAFIAAQYALLLSLLMLLPPFGFLFFIVGTEIVLATVAGPPILIHTIIHEGSSARDAWPRTKQIMKGQWLRIVMNMLTVVLGLGILQYALLQGFALGADAAGIEGRLPLSLVLVGAQTLFAALALPLVFLGWFVSYLDARARNDGLTRDELLSEIAAQGADRQAGLTGP